MRTRFPPSPTGFLHVGSLRTALYNYLIAKQTKDHFLLRIEDTDREREVAGATEDILTSLAWAGIAPDEGVTLEDGRIVERGERGPYVQSARQAKGIYKKYADELLENGHAYRCFCTTQRLDEMRKDMESRKQAPMYDRRCLHLSADEVRKNMAAGMPHVVRLKSPHERTIRIADDIRGDLTFAGHTIDDQVLVKSDGFPTYHLANVVDDHLMAVDLVLRGEEWLSSLPKHVLLYEAFGWTPPRFAHVPLLLNKNRTKLSKREGAVSVREYIAKGYLPEAMLNFLALLGWNPGTTEEMFTLPELIERFSLDRVQKAGAVFDVEKLDWLQGQWMRKLPEEEFQKRVREILARDLSAATEDPKLPKKVSLIRERITFFHEAPDMLRFFYEEPTVTLELLANEKQKVTRELLPKILEVVIAMLEAIPEQDWSEEKIFAVTKRVVSKGEWKLGQLLWPLRAALTGLPYSPGAVEVAAALGKEKTMARFQKARSLR